MPIFTHTQSSFLNGEISPDYASRSDLNAKQNGLYTLTNAYITSSGGIRRREGLKYINKLQNKGKLFAFTVNNKENYIVILQSYKMFLYKNDSLMYTYDTLYSEQDLHQVQTSQNLTQMIFTHMNYPPYILSTDTALGFTFQPLQYKQLDDGSITMPFYNFADKSQIKITPSDTTGIINITSNEEIFDESFKDTYLKINDGIIKIISTTSPTLATAITLKTLSSKDESKLMEGVFSARRGYPKTSCFHQGRLVFACTKSHLNKIWFSKTFDYFNFDIGEGLDDEAIEFEILSNGTEEIQNIFSALHLQILTNSSEWIVDSATLTPTTVSVAKQTSIGSPTDIFLPVQLIESATIFVSKDKREIREFIYGQVVNNYTSNNLSQLSSHLIKKPTDISYNKTERKLYVCMESGYLAVLTISLQNEVIAWSKYETKGKFLSVQVCDDKTYVFTKRDENFYLEKFEEDTYTDLNKAEIFETEMEIIQIPDFLQNKEVYVKTDDSVYKKGKVEKELKLKKTCKKYEAGLPFKHTIIPFPMTSVAGTGIKSARLISAVFKMHESFFMNIDTGTGIRNTELSKKNFSQSPQKFSGDYFLKSIGYKSNGTSPLWKIQTDYPYNFCILSTALKIKTN